MGMTLDELYNKLESEKQNCKRKLLTKDVICDKESSEERELAYLDGYKDALIYVLDELREVEDGSNY